VISLIIYLKNNSRDSDEETTLLGKSKIIPSSTKAAENSNNQLATLSFIVGEMFRTLLI